MKASSLAKRIKKQGLNDRLYFHRYRLSNDEYHACNIAVSSTALKDLYHSKNPRLCYEKYIAKSLPPVTSDAMLLGNATHKIILEPRSFKKEFEVWDGQRRGNEYKAFVEYHAGKHILTMSQYDEIRRLKDAVMANSEACQLLSGGEAEQSVFWRDELTEVLCRARADYKKEVNGSRILVDLKTCRSAEPEQFAKDLINLGYPIQEAMYREGFQADAFAFVAVEKGAFPTVQVYTLDDLFDQCGHLMFRQALEKWGEYLKADHWPSYSDDPVTQLDCPEWFANRILG